MQIYQIVVTLWLPLVLASSGDWLPQFRFCVEQCVSNECPRSLGPLALLLWTCEDDCDYRCQQQVTDAQEAAGERIHQYHGKWPFTRWFGIQEPASVLFSIFNFIPNMRGWNMLARRRKGSANRMRRLYRGAALFGMNAWLWSSIFHVRDFPITERLDYFSATSAVAYGLVIAAARLFMLFRPGRWVYMAALSAVMAVMATAHVYYLAFVHFDYGYNMAASVAVGAVQTLLWISYSIHQWRCNKDPRGLIPGILVIAVSCGMGFELLDFAPLGRALDAHALWHLATVLPYHFWFRWMEYDLKLLEASPALGKEKAN